MSQPRSMATTLLDADALYARAVRLLAARARAAAELERLLQPRAASAAALRSALDRLREHGYLDDGKFAEAFCRYHRDADGWGPARCRRELLRRGVAGVIATAALAAGFAETDEAALLAAYLRRKHVRRPETPAQTASLLRRLWQAGYAPGAIHAALAAWRLKPEWLEDLELAGDAADPAAE